MEKCAYCGEPVGEEPLEWHDEVFCSEDCMRQFDIGQHDGGYQSDDDHDDNAAYPDY